MSKKTIEITINGIVQGVGFRPFIFRLAKELGINGEVSNTEKGVSIKASAEENVLEIFKKRIPKEAPPLSIIRSIKVTQTSNNNFKDFKIIKSLKTGKVATEISPDVATCRDCLREIFDPSDRRYNYAFTNCTNCGPRYTIIESLPYDRPFTSMKNFKMCEKCQEEYDNPLNRRFHAQPNACPKCGPSLFFKEKNGEEIKDSPLEFAVEKILADKIIAIKGLGGFHLACNAFSTKALKRLRKRKKRPFKPFAIMVKDIKTIKNLAFLDENSLNLLTSFRAPIVLLSQKNGNKLSGLVAPNIHDIGIMLPYTPLHHLLLNSHRCPEALVMTSGNPKDEPLCTENKEAFERLGDFVDGFLFHNRDIYTGVDDTVLRHTSIGPVFIRRSRGYAPSPIPLKKANHNSFNNLIGLGAELKNTFCIIKDGNAYLSQHMGNLTTRATFNFYKKNITHLSKLLEVIPKFFACDLHPDYLSTRFALESGLPVIKVQHHFAHAASVMAEHGLKGPVVAICLDGTGLGTDKTIWGGELLLCTEKDFKRLARIRPFRLPGGDSCAKNPWRSALSLLTAAFGQDFIMPTSLKKAVNLQDAKFIKQMILKGINSPWTSSCGRLFDAVASLLGICHENTYEAQAPMELEALALNELKGLPITKTGHFGYFFEKDMLIKRKKDMLELDWQPFLKEFLLSDSLTRKEKALLFHAFLIAGFSKMALDACDKTGVKEVIISGGTLQNRIISEGFWSFFREKGLICYKNEMVPPNDGGICLGQAFVASSILQN